MSFSNTIEKFLAFKKDDSDFFESSLTTYRCKINVFKEYMLDTIKLNDINYERILRGMNEEEIIKSLEDYVLTRGIKFINTANCYMTVLKEYFMFLLNQLEIRNEVFSSIERLNKLEKLVGDQIKKLNLREADDKKPISENGFKRLNDHCNRIIDEFEINQMKAFDGKYKNPYDNFVSAMMTKIVMFFGVKSFRPLEIEKNHLDLDLNMLKIDNYWIHLPNNLSRQLKKYYRISIELFGQKSNMLFVDRNGNSFDANSYGQTYKVINDIFGTSSAEIVAKYTIIEMIKQGINVSLILDLTGFGVDTYFYCQEAVDEGKSVVDRTKYLDSKMRKLDIYEFV